MQIDWFTFAAQLINFVILLILLRKFLYGPVITAMDAREKRISDRLKEARLQREKAENEKKLYESRRISLQKKEEEMLKDAKLDVAEQKKKLLHEARIEVEATQQKWKEALEREQDAFAQQFRERAGQQVIETIRKITTDLANQELESLAIARFIQQLHVQISGDQKQILEVLQNTDSSIIIKTGFQLSEENRNRLEQELQHLGNGSVDHTYQVNENMGFGIELHTDGWKLAWSMQSYLDELEQQVRKVYQTRR